MIDKPEPRMTTTKRGVVLRGTASGRGLFTAGGRQYTFISEGTWLSAERPHPGMSVGVEFDGHGAPIALRAVYEASILNGLAAPSSAGFQDRPWRSALKPLVGFELSNLIAEGLLIVGWFFVAFLTTKEPSVGGVENWTFWKILNRLSVLRV